MIIKILADKDHDGDAFSDIYTTRDKFNTAFGSDGLAALDASPSWNTDRELTYTVDFNSDTPKKVNYIDIPSRWLNLEYNNVDNIGSYISHVGMYDVSGFSGYVTLLHYDDNADEFKELKDVPTTKANTSAYTSVDKEMSCVLFNQGDEYFSRYATGKYNTSFTRISFKNYFVTGFIRFKFSAKDANNDEVTLTNDIDADNGLYEYIIPTFLEVSTFSPTEYDSISDMYTAQICQKKPDIFMLYAKGYKHAGSSSPVLQLNMIPNRNSQISIKYIKDPTVHLVISTAYTKIAYLGSESTEQYSTSYLLDKDSTYTVSVDTAGQIRYQTLHAGKINDLPNDVQIYYKYRNSYVMPISYNIFDVVYNYDEIMPTELSSIEIKSLLDTDEEFSVYVMWLFK